MALGKAAQHVDTQSVSDLTQKGPGVPDAVDTVDEGPEVKNLALSTPRHDVPVAVSVVGFQNTHTPPDLDEFDVFGRPLGE